MTDDPDTDPYRFSPIATIRSCYPQRFGIPRQAGLVKSATADIVFEATESNRLSLRGLDDFSHLWVIFVFHGQNYRRSKPLVWPPRLGGKKTMGVFATRSPNRPNPIGMSAVTIAGIAESGGEILVNITGGDFLDGTPVLDIKPYVPFVDSIKTATSSWAKEPDDNVPVRWSAEARITLDQLATSSPDFDIQNTRLLIDETIAQDPRPAHERNKDGNSGQQWHMRIRELDVSWSVTDGIAEVVKIVLW